MNGTTTGSLILDAILALVSLMALAAGYRQGGFSAFLSLVGVIIGGLLGMQLVPFVLHKVAEYNPSDGMRFLAALLTITLMVVIGYVIGSGLGLSLRDQIKTRQVLRFESGLGAVVQVFTVLIVAWLILVPLGTNNSSPFGKAVRKSVVLGTIGAAAPDWVKQLPARTAALINASGFPMITDPLESLPTPEVEAPDTALEASPAVAATRDSVVQVVGQAEKCSRLLQGSGWVVDQNTVMTNAHVVAGTDRVQLRTTGGAHEAKVVYYNPQEDIALLRASDLNLVPMKWAEEAGVEGQDAIVMGYPLGGPFEVSPARIRDSFVVSGPNIYASERVERESYSVRGHIVQGNSGGPLIDTRGHVLGLVFGADVNEEDTGYALTRQEVMSHVGDVSQYRTPVDTGACVVG